MDRTCTYHTWDTKEKNVRKAERKRPLGKPKHRSEGNIKLDKRTRV